MNRATAAQIADMVNAHNGLVRPLSADRIMFDPGWDPNPLLALETS
jgi:hypothetical protein